MLRRLALAAGAAALVVLTIAACRARIGGPALARAPAPDGANAPVLALRYRTWVVESALEATHGGGEWIEELWFPEAGVVANVKWEWDMAAFAEGRPSVRTPVMHAFHGPLRNKSSRGLEPEVEQPTEEVLVPHDVAQRLFAHAEATRRLGQDAKSVAADLARDGLFHDVSGADAE